MPIEDLMWVEKYRPSKLEELVDQETIKQRLRLMLVKKGELPHLLFAGPPGSGKTTTAMILARQILGEHWRDYTLSLNASDERGIDTVRQRIKTFARFVDRPEGVPFRLVILDEADEMCLHPDTGVIVGRLGDLSEMTLRDLHATFGEAPFSIPSFGEKGMRLEDDEGKIVPSGEAELYRITFDDGRTVSASADHPFFVIRGRRAETLRTRELHEGVELAEFSNRILRCHACSRPFFRPNPWSGYSRRFCSRSCRNVFFGSMSINRSLEERRKNGLLGIQALKTKGTYTSEGYRHKRSETARRLISEGKIPDPRTWKKYAKGEGAFLGKNLSESHRKAISDGDKKFFASHPEVIEMISRKIRTSLLDPFGPYQQLVRSGFFKEASRRASMASLDSWKKKGFRSKTEAKMAELLGKWGISFVRERVIVSGPRGKYPFAVDFLVGKVAIFVNGCWWHVCPSCGVPPKYEKQRRNIEKDERHYRELARLGYRVVVVWEHELESEKAVREEVLSRIYQAVGISGGGPPRIAHARVKSIERLVPSPVLNISVSRNKNFVLANGILTHNTNDGQTALRRIMEENSAQTRFVLICNYSSGIIEALQSRCAIFRFQRYDEASVTEHLKSIAKKEKLKVASEGVFGAIYEGTKGDLRQAINLLQAAGASGEVTAESVHSVTGATVKARVSEVMRLALDGDFDAARAKMIELTRVYGIPERDFLRFANESLGTMKVDDPGAAISILAEYDFRLVEGSQPELQLTAMLAQLSSLKRKVA